MSVIITMSNTGASVFNCDARAASVITDALSYDVEGAEFSAGFKMGRWNGRRSFMSWSEGRPMFHAGFVGLVKRALEDAKIPVSIKDLREEVIIKGDEIKLLAVNEAGEAIPFELRDYQLEAIGALAREKRGIIQAATGSGKTEIGAAAIQHFGQGALWLTHSLHLVEQTRGRFHTRFGRPVGMISEGDWMPADITVATVQTIMSHWRIRWRAIGKDKEGNPLDRIVFGDNEREAIANAMKREKPVKGKKMRPPFYVVERLMMDRDDSAKVLNFLRSIKFLIVDEAHRSSADQFFKIIAHCTNAYLRLSLTATPLMKSSREDNLKLIASSGDVIYRVTNWDLIKRGILAQPHFTYCEIPKFRMEDGRRPNSSTHFPDVYKAGIVHNSRRNWKIVQKVKEFVDKGRQTVVLVKEIDHGGILQDLLEREGIRSVWLDGSDDVKKVRKPALARLRKREINVIVATTIFDEGLDEDSISAVILGGGYKSKISLFQRVGRSVRARKGEDLQKFGNTAEIVDFLDIGDRRLAKHSAERYDTVKNEEGWIIAGLEPWDEKLFDGKEPDLFSQNAASKKHSQAILPIVSPGF